MSELKDRVFGLIIAAIAISSVFMQPAGTHPETAAARSATDGDWLFLAYMSADEPGAPLNWSADINEMEAGLLSQNITIIAMVDPPGIGDTKVYKIIRDPKRSDAIVSTALSYPPLGSGGEANMGDPATLSDFLVFGVENYYIGGKVGVILWGHGNGWIGVCEDRGDYLEPKEFAQGLSDAQSLIGNEVDLVIFDACSMGSIEALSLLSGIAAYSVSSEMEVPDYGFPYEPILTGISEKLDMNASEAAGIFVEEYVKFGALVANTTSQAAAIDLDELAETASELDSFSQQAILFMHLARPILYEQRNLSYDFPSGGTVDLAAYLGALSGDPDSPTRFSDLCDGLRESVLNSTIANRVFVSPSDAQLIGQDSLQGVSIFFPEIATALGNYSNSSTAAEDWALMLEELWTPTSFAPPAAATSIEAKDLRFNDGLNDSFSFEWNPTPEIEFWSCDALLIPGGDIAGTLEFLDSAPNSGNLDDLAPGTYNLCIYGIGPDDTYEYYRVFGNESVIRRYTFIAHLPETVASGELTIENLRTGEISKMAVSGNNASMSFVVPSPYSEGDRILLTFSMGNTTVARGLIVLTGDISDVYLVEISQPATIASLVLFMLVAAVAVFAFIKLRGKRRLAASRPKKMRE
jgi:hypothetical protein